MPKPNGTRHQAKRTPMRRRSARGPRQPGACEAASRRPGARPAARRPARTEQAAPGSPPPTWCRAGRRSSCSARRTRRRHGERVHERAEDEQRRRARRCPGARRAGRCRTGAGRPPARGRAPGRPERRCRAGTPARSRDRTCSRGCRPWPAGRARVRSRAARSAGGVGSRRPAMQSAVRQRRGTSTASRTRISSGDTVDARKLNWPTGQRCLQNVAPLNTRSTSERHRKVRRARGTRLRAAATTDRTARSVNRTAANSDSRDPLAAQPRRASRHRGRVQPPSPVADADERTAGAEDVAGRQQRDDEQAAIVHPRQQRREIARRELRPEEAVQHDDGRGARQARAAATSARAATEASGPTTGQRSTSSPVVAIGGGMGGRSRSARRMAASRGRPIDTWPTAPPAGRRRWQLTNMTQSPAMVRSSAPIGARRRSLDGGRRPAPFPGGVIWPSTGPRLPRIGAAWRRCCTVTCDLGRFTDATARPGVSVKSAATVAPVPPRRDGRPARRASDAEHDDGVPELAGRAAHQAVAVPLMPGTGAARPYGRRRGEHVVVHARSPSE